MSLELFLFLFFFLTVERSRVYGSGFVCRVSALRIKWAFREDLKEEEEEEEEGKKAHWNTNSWCVSFCCCCYWFCFVCLFVVVVFFAQRPDLCWEGLTRTKTAIHKHLIEHAYGCWQPLALSWRSDVLISVFFCLFISVFVFIICSLRKTANKTAIISLKWDNAKDEFLKYC